MPQIQPVTLDGKKFQFKPKYTMKESKTIRKALIGLGNEVGTWADSDEDELPQELDGKWREVAKQMFGEVEIPSLDDLGEEGLWDVTMGFSGRYFPAKK